MAADYVALPGRPTAQHADRSTEELHPVPQHPFWPHSPTHFHATPGLVLHTSDENDDSHSTWAGATHHTALTPATDTPAE
jgi:hypothetical protein